MFTPYLVPHLLPIFVLVALTFVVLTIMGYRRFSTATQYPRSYYKLLRVTPGQSFEPLPHVEQSARNVVNLFEVPVLFYAATFLILELRTQDEITLGLSWAFVLTRVAHSFVHLTSNNVMRRMSTYILGGVALLALWVYLAWKIFT